MLVGTCGKIDRNSNHNETNMIDSDGYRSNVGIVLCNGQGRLFWAKRIGQNAWQFPQGGIRRNEKPEQAMYRELYEETGLQRDHVRLIGQTRRWLKYRLPRRYIRRGCQPVCIGQKQRWFFLELTGAEQDVSLDLGKTPEFETWRWVNHWQPVKEVVYFKRGVYKQALDEFRGYILERDS